MTIIPRIAAGNVVEASVTLTPETGTVALGDVTARLRKPDGTEVVLSGITGVNPTFEVEWASADTDPSGPLLAADTVELTHSAASSPVKAPIAASAASAVGYTCTFDPSARTIVSIAPITCESERDHKKSFHDTVGSVEVCACLFSR